MCVYSHTIPILSYPLILSLALSCSVEDFLGLLVKLVHYNSAYLDEDALTSLLSLSCSLANQSTQPSETEVSLSLCPQRLSLCGTL